MAYEFDLAVLGGGPGGYEAAIRAAQYGLKVCLVERDLLGGTCLNRGCIPTKALLHGAEVMEVLREAPLLGIGTGEARLDYAALAAFKDGQVSRLRRGVEQLEKANGVTVIKSDGRLEGAHALMAGDRAITADKLILATGSRPARPPVPGLSGPQVMDSDQVLAMQSLPRSVVIIGGGVIGIEFATLFSGLGGRVTVLEMMEDILPGVDPEITAQMRALLKKRGIDIHLGARVSAVKSGQGVQVSYQEAGREAVAEGERCLVCAGRAPNTGNIGLEEAGVTLDGRGYVRVDEYLQTSLDGVYAIGDITGKMQLAHVASAQGLTAAANCAGRRQRMEYGIVPACVYTSPEIAYVGQSERAARQAGRKISVGRFDVAANGRALAMNRQEGLVKLVCDQESGEILGCQMLCPRATDMISEVAAVMRCEGTVEELSSTIHPHPTLSEIIMEAAADAQGLCCHAMPRRPGGQ